MNKQILDSQDYFVDRCIRNNREIKKRCYIWFDESDSNCLKIRADYFINRTHIGTAQENCNEPSSIYWLNWEISQANLHGYNVLYKRM